MIRFLSTISFLTSLSFKTSFTRFVLYLIKDNNLLSNLSNLDDINNIKLQENDLVVVRKELGFQEKEYVTVEGLVKFPGTYAIKNNNYSFYDLIQDFGGFLKDASLDGVKIVRKNNLAENLNEENNDELLGVSSNDSLNIKIKIKPFI